MNPYIKAIIRECGNSIFDYRNTDRFHEDLKRLPPVNQLRFALDQAIACSYFFWLHGVGYDEFLNSYSKWLKDFVYNHLSKYTDEFVSYAAGKMYEACRSIIDNFYSPDWTDIDINDVAVFVYKAVTQKEVTAPLALDGAFAAAYLSHRNSLPKKVDVPEAFFVPRYYISDGYISISSVCRSPGYQKELPLEIESSLIYKDLMAEAAQNKITFIDFLIKASLTNGITRFESILGILDNLCPDPKTDLCTVNGNSRLFYATHCALRRLFCIDFLDVARIYGRLQSTGIADSRGIGQVLIRLLGYLNKYHGVVFGSKDLFIAFFRSGRLLDPVVKRAVNFVAEYANGTTAEDKAAFESLGISCEAINLISQTTTTSIAQVRGADETVMKDKDDDQEETLDLSDIPDIDVAEPGLEAEEEEDTTTDGDESQESDDSSSKEGSQGDNSDEQTESNPYDDIDGGDESGDNSPTDPEQTSDMPGSGEPEDIDGSDSKGVVFKVSPEGSETVDSVIIREEIDKFLTDILANPPKKLSPQSVSALTTLQKNWVHILSVETIVGILEQIVSVPAKFKQLNPNKE